MPFRATPGWVKGRQLTAGERDEARHMFQVLFENTRSARNAIDPREGVFGLSVGQFRSQWAAMKRDLDSFTERVSVGHLPADATPAAEVTLEQLNELARRYTPAEDQKCRVCGAPLAFSSSGDRGGGSRWNCSSDAATSRTAPLRARLDHYEQSAWYDRGQTDPLVALLVRAYRSQLEGRR